MRTAIRSALLLIATLAGIPALAQPGAGADRFGAYGSLAINVHTAALEGLPGVPSCSPVYRSGTGLGPTFGVLYERSLSDPLFLALRAGYSSSGAVLRVNEVQTVAIDDAAAEVTIEHSIDAALSSLTLAPSAGWRVSEALVVSAGVELGYLVGASYAQEERISEESRRGRFENGRRVRNEASGELPSVSRLQAAIALGSRVELPLDAARTLLVAPEATLLLALTNVIEGESWRAHALRLGASIMYSPRAVTLAPIAAAPAEFLEAKVDARGIDVDGSELPVARLRVEEQIASNVRPLLAYLFFDDGSAELPTRYRRITIGDTESYAGDSLHQRELLAAYHDVLNIVGHRLRESPAARLRLVGTNAGASSPGEDRVLSRRRAEVVRDYLRDHWGIAADRLAVDAVDLPSAPSNTGLPEGIAENRRVELSSNDPTILAPIRTTDTTRETTPPALRFRTATRSSAGVASWRLTVRQGLEPLKELAGEGPVPETLEWAVEQDQSSAPRAPGTLTYELALVDAKGERAKTSGTLEVEQITVRSRRRDRIDDMLVERFSLLLFEFDRADIREVHRGLIDGLRGQISEESRVTVVGYADRIGDEARNRQLSRERALAVVRALELDESRVEAWGDTTPPYDQSLPEGRFYSRGVVVEVKTPDAAR